MKSRLFAKRRPVALIVLLTFLCTSLQLNHFAIVHAAEEEQFINVSATTVEGTSYTQENCNNSQFKLVRNNEEVLGFASSSIKSSGWDGQDKYWQMSLSTKDYENVKLSFQTRSSNKGPHKFSIQYSCDGSTYTAIEGSTYEIEGTTLKDTIFANGEKELTLPTEAWNQPIVYLRLVSTGDASSADGVSNVNNIRLKGTKVGQSSEASKKVFITADVTSNVSTGSTVTADTVIEFSVENITAYDYAAESVTGDSIKVATGSSIHVNLPGNSIPTSQCQLSYQVNGGEIKNLIDGKISASDLGVASGDVRVRVYVRYQGSSSLGTEFVYHLQEAPVTPISEARQASEGSNVTVKGVISFIDGRNVYVQDTTGGIDLYLKAVNGELKVGQTVTASGSKTTYKGLEELQNAVIIQHDTSIQKIVPVPISSLKEFLDNYDTYGCQIIALKDLTINKINTSGNTVLKDNDGNQVNLYKVPEAAIADVKEGDIIDIIAAVGDYNGVQLRVGDQCGIKVHQPVIDPVKEELFTEGVLHLPEVDQAENSAKVTTIGQVVAYYGSNGVLDTVVLEDVIEEEIYGLQIYDKNNLQKFTVGDVVKVTGTKGTYGECPQISSVTSVDVLEHSTEVIQPQQLTIAQLLEGQDQYLSESVVIKDVTLGAYNSKNTSIIDATGSINLYKGPAYEGVKEGDVVDLYCVWSKYNTTYQLRAGKKDCYKKSENVQIDDSITLPLVSWAGNPSTPYNTATVYADATQANDQLNQEASLSLSTGTIPGISIESGNYLGSKGLTDGGYYQMVFPTKGYGGIDLSFKMKGSSSGPKNFIVLYSTDGEHFTKCNKITYTTSVKNWTTGETTTTPYVDQDKFHVLANTYTEYYVELPEAVNHQNNVTIRIQVAGTESINGGTIGNSGTNYFTNVSYTAHPVIANDMCQAVKITPDAGAVALNQELTMTTGTNGATIYYQIDSGETKEYQEDNKPVLDTLPATVKVYASKDGLNKSIATTYGYTQLKVATVKASPNGGAVKADAMVMLTCATSNAKILYSTDDGATWNEYSKSLKLSELPVKIKAKATLEGYVDSEETTFEYSKRENDEYNIYFGQIHSHTEYSDGAGTARQAYEYASQKAENIDFLAVTDHSNSFDNDTSATIKDGSVSSEWIEGHQLADEYTNTTDQENLFVGIYGYEMTWSGGAPGHMNTYNTDGFLSRNMDGYKNASTASLPNYYAQLKTVPGSISMFNHPGTTFGDFYDFAFYDEEIDQLITLIEVGNGEGAIGSSGYFPSYEYYTRALDKGWHVAPTNNQDNHKGVWGDANTGRTVILADSLSRDNIYDALRNMRTYATEDDDLKIWYTLNGADMGTIFDEKPDTVQIEAKVEDPTDASIGKVEVIVNGGLSVATKKVDANEGIVRFDLQPDYSYYYLRITQPDGDIAVTAPVWISDVEAVGISSITTSASLEVSGEPIDVTTTLYNNEDTDFHVDSIVYTINGDVIHTTNVEEAGLSVCKSQKELKDSFEYTYDGLGKTEIVVTVIGKLNGVSKQYSSVLQLNYISPAMVTRVIVDGTHNNDYVTGYYGGNVGNFADIAAADYVKVEVVTDKITEDMLKNCALLVLSAPAKKTGTYNGKSYGATHFDEDFMNLVKKYVDAGGNVIFCGLADYQDSKDGQSSTEINKLLTYIGATTRLNSDEVVDDEKNGGQQYRLYFDDFNKDSKYLAGVTDAQTYSAYSGSSVVLNKDSVAAGKAEALVYGHDTTYSINSKDFDSNYIEFPKGSIVALAHETLASGSEIFVGGTVFLSNFEVKTDLDNASESYYANRNILLNIMQEIKTELPTSTIAELRAGEPGQVFAVEGYVTAGTAVEGNAFFDTIYVQDETAGTTVFPIADPGIKIGTKIRIVGYVDGYQGDKEIQVIEYKILDEENLNVIEPKEVTTKEATDYNALGGSLLKVQGIVTKVVTNSAGVDYFYVKDASGVEARVFIDGYILASDGKDTVNDDVKVGNEVSAIGLSYFNPDGACLRVRDRAEVVLVQAATVTPTIEPSITPSITPSVEPSVTPSVEPSVTPSVEPSVTPSITPSVTPTKAPQYDSSVIPTIEPSVTPTETPTTSDSTKETLQQAEKRINNEAVRVALKENKNNTDQVEVKLQLRYDGVLSKDILRQVKGSNLVLVIDLGSGIQCKIDATQIDTVNQDMNLRVSLDTKKVPSKVIKKELSSIMPEGMKMQQVSLDHDGVFAVPVTFTFDVSKLVTSTIKNKQIAGLYYYNTETKNLELQSLSKITKSGYTSFTFGHASDYVIVVTNQIVFDEQLLSQIAYEDQKENSILYVGGTTGKSEQLKISYPKVIKQALESHVIKTKVKYSTSDPKIVSVSKDSTIKAKGTGRAIVKATVTINGQTITLERIVTVKKAKVKIIATDKKIKVGENIEVTCKPYGYRSEDIVWSTKKNKIVAVKKNKGKLTTVVTGKMIGTAEIVVKAKKASTTSKIQVVK